MTLSAEDLASVRRVLDKIDAGMASPRMPGAVGRFLRQYERGRADLARILLNGRIERRADGAISGRTLDTIELLPLLAPEVSLLRFPFGEIAETLAVSEQLGGLTSFDMWLRGPVANAAYNVLREDRGLRLTGDYRWTPPARLTPGEATLAPSSATSGWQTMRCLKAVADDITRPAHALEFVLDYRMGPPGLKYFRVVCAAGRDDGWEVLPALAEPRRLDIATSEGGPHVEVGGVSELLIYCEPWSRVWTIVATAPVTSEDVVAHAISWADFRRELDGAEIDAAMVTGIRESLRSSGLRPQGLGEPNLTRSLIPVARDILRWLHGSP